MCHWHRIEVTTPARAGSLKFKLLSLAAKELWVFRARCAKLYGQMAEPERNHAKPHAEPEAVHGPGDSDDTAAGTSLAGAFKFSPGLPAVKRGKVPSEARQKGALSRNLKRALEIQKKRRQEQTAREPLREPLHLRTEQRVLARTLGGYLGEYFTGGHPLIFISD